MKTPFITSSVLFALLLSVAFAAHASAQAPAPVPELTAVPPIPEVPPVPDFLAVPEIALVAPPIPPDAMIAMEPEPPLPPVELFFVTPPMPTDPPVPLAPPEFLWPVEPLLAVPFAIPQTASPTVPPVPPAPAVPPIPPQPAVPTPPRVPAPPRVPKQQTPAVLQAPVAPQAAAQTFPPLESFQSQAELDKPILAQDTALFDAFNRCDLEKFSSFIADDVEFYHDQGGVRLGKDKFTEGVKDNDCGGDIRRELVPSTFQAHYMQGYGAVELGVHRFVHPQSNNPTGQGRFISLWQYKDGKWKITRAISFDHH